MSPQPLHNRTSPRRIVTRSLSLSLYISLSLSLSLLFYSIESGKSFSILSTSLSSSGVGTLEMLSRSTFSGCTCLYSPLSVCSLLVSDSVSPSPHRFVTVWYSEQCCPFFRQWILVQGSITWSVQLPQTGGTSCKGERLPLSERMEWLSTNDSCF